MTSADFQTLLPEIILAGYAMIALIVAVAVFLRKILIVFPSCRTACATSDTRTFRYWLLRAGSGFLN